MGKKDALRCRIRNIGRLQEGQRIENSAKSENDCGHDGDGVDDDLVDDDEKTESAHVQFGGRTGGLNMSAKEPHFLSQGICLGCAAFVLHGTRAVPEPDDAGLIGVRQGRWSEVAAHCFADAGLRRDLQRWDREGLSGVQLRDGGEHWDFVEIGTLGAVTG